MSNISKINVVMWVTDDGKTFETPEEAEAWAKYLEHECGYESGSMSRLYAQGMGGVDFDIICAWILDNKEAVQDILDHSEALESVNTCK